MCWQIHKLLLNGFTGISCCYNVNLQSSSLSKNFKKFRLFEKYNEVGNTSIAKWTKHLSEGLRFVVWPGLIYKTKTPFISRQLTTNKAFKRGSSFCSLTRLNLQNEDPIHFASVGVWGKALTRLDWLWFDRPVKKTSLRFRVLGLRSLFCRHPILN